MPTKTNFKPSQLLDMTRGTVANQKHTLGKVSSAFVPQTEAQKKALAGVHGAFGAKPQLGSSDPAYLRMLGIDPVSQQPGIHKTNVSPTTGRTVRSTLGSDGVATPLPKQDTYQSTLAGYLDDPRRQGPSPEDQAQIRQQMLDAQQGEIDSVNKFYAQQRQEEQVEGMGRLGQTRALSARGGVLGSDFGAAAKEKTTGYNVQQQEMIEAKRGAAISSILTGVQNRADAMIEARRTEAREDFDKYVGTLKALRDESITGMTQLANTGVTLDEVPRDVYDNILQQTGFHPFILEHLYNDALPEEQRKEYKFTSTSRGVVASTVGLDGKPEVEFFDYPGVEEGDDVHFSGGVPYITSTDENGKKTVKIAEGFETGGEFAPKQEGEETPTSTIQTVEGESIDLATVSGLQRIRELGVDSYAEMDSFLADADISTSVRKNLLLEAGFSTPTSGGTIEDEALPFLVDQITASITKKVSEKVPSDYGEEHDVWNKFESTVQKEKEDEEHKKLIKQYKAQIKAGLFRPKVGGETIKLTPEQQEQLLKLLEE